MFYSTHELARRFAQKAADGTGVPVAIRWLEKTSDAGIGRAVWKNFETVSTPAARMAEMQENADRIGEKITFVLPDAKIRAASVVSDALWMYANAQVFSSDEARKLHDTLEDRWVLIPRAELEGLNTAINEMSEAVRKL